MQTKLTVTHDRITLVVKHGRDQVARVTWGRSGTRVSGTDVWQDEAFTRRFLSALAQKAHHQEGRTLGDHAKHLQGLMESTEDRAALLALIA